AVSSAQEPSRIERRRGKPGRSHIAASRDLSMRQVLDRTVLSGPNSGQDTFPAPPIPDSSPERTRVQAHGRLAVFGQPRVPNRDLVRPMAMPAVSILLVLLAQSGTPVPRQAAAAATGFRPSGSPAELHDLGLLARLRDPGVQPVGFSSYDRTGGNNDGFNGTYSRIRAEDGNSVLAEVDGPGVVQRIWFTHTSGEQPGLLDRKQEHVKIYIDGRDRPALDVPLETIFSGTHPHFPRPLVCEGSGGFVSYVPIPFQKGCKILVEGLGVRFYQIGLIKLPAGADVTSFTEQPGPEARAELARAAALWSQPGEYESRELASADVAHYDVEGLASSTHQYALRAGPATIRSFEIIPAAGTEDAWRAARLRMVWDHDEAADAGVDLPLGQAFGWVEGSGPY